MTAAHPDGALLDDLAARIDTAIRTALNGARNVALVNFPNHNNPGDVAIWLGALASLRRLGVRVRYQCAWCTFSPEALARALPEGPVLINGGGNFGDLYQGQQGLRERLFAELTDRHLIQLPQSIHFGQQDNLDRVRTLIADHGRVTLMMREDRSERFAAENFDASVHLVPDMALALRRIERPVGSPQSDMLWLHRMEGDAEYVDHGFPLGEGVREVEWIRPQENEPEWSRSHEKAREQNARLLEECRNDPEAARRRWKRLARTFAPLSEGYVRRGMEIIATGRVLVTDKLHGHILSLLAGIPHVVLDNSYGKVSGVYRTWTKDSTLSHWADSGAEAHERAQEFLPEAGVR